MGSGRSRHYRLLILREQLDQVGGRAVKGALCAVCGRWVALVNTIVAKHLAPDRGGQGIAQWQRRHGPIVRARVHVEVQTFKCPSSAYGTPFEPRTNSPIAPARLPIFMQVRRRAQG